MRKSLIRILDSFSNENSEGLTFLNENGEIFHKWSCGDQHYIRPVWKVELFAQEKEKVRNDGMEFANVGVAIIV